MKQTKFYASKRDMRKKQVYIPFRIFHKFLRYLENPLIFLTKTHFE